MTGPSAPARDDAPLASLWQAALARPLHGGACGCAAPLVVRIDAASLEFDLLDFVETRHQLQDLQAWQAALARRRAAATSSFPVWIASLNGAHIEPGLHERIVSDIRTTLLSMTEHAAGRLAPVSALASGWLTKQTTN